MATKIQSTKIYLSFKPVFLSAVLIFSLQSLRASSLQTNLQDSLLLDESIRQGRLPNGFTYYIKSLGNPQPYLQLNFLVKAGSDKENNNQLNIAHAVEHLAFKATPNFPEGIFNDKRLTALGMGMYDFGAYSSHLITQYNFRAPPNNIKALNYGLLWFKDIAVGLRFSKAAINQVRGELRQEFLGKVGGDLNNFFAHSQLDSQLYSCKLDYSNFLDHHRTFKHKTLHSFYKDWYRPDLMAISIVGNIEDLDEIEMEIKNRFSNIPTVINPRKERDCHTEFFKRQPQYAVVERLSNLNSTGNDIKVDIKLVYREPGINSVINFSEKIKNKINFQLLLGIVRQRFKEVTNTYNSFDIVVYDTEKTNGLSAMETNLTVHNGQEKNALEKTIEVFNQLKRFGVSIEEWDNNKKQLVQNLQSRDDGNSNYWIKQIESNFILQEPLLSLEQDNSISYLSNSSHEEFNKYIGTFLSNIPEDIGIIAPTGHEVLVFNEKEVRSWLKHAFNKEIEPYLLPVTPSSLMDRGEVWNLNQKKYVENKKDLGIREFILENGLRLVLKSVEPAPGYEKDIIKIHGYSLKGANCFPKEKYFSAINSPSIVRNSGVNGIDKFVLNRFLSSKNILPSAVSSYVDIHETGIQGNSSIENLEIVLQLIYLYFTRPNIDLQAFKDWKFMEKRSVKDPLDKYFRQSIKERTGDSTVVGDVLNKKSLQGGTSHFQGIDSTNFQIANQLYNSLFGNAADFTFIVSGDFDIEKFTPLFNKYLGNLPNRSLNLSCAAINMTNNSTNEGPSFQEIYLPTNQGMKNIKYAFKFMAPAKDPLNWQEQIRVEALGAITNRKVWSLRFEKDYALYLVGALGKFNPDFRRYEISSNFECLPSEYPLIRKEVHQIITDIKVGLITDDQFQKGMHRMYSIYDKDKAKQHHVIHQNLYEHYRYGSPIIEPAEIERFVKSLKVEDIVQTANKYYKDLNLYEFIMREKTSKN